MSYSNTERLKKIEAVLDHILPETITRNWTEEVFNETSIPVPLALAHSLSEGGRDLLTRGGKRWRPLMMTLVCETLYGEDEAIHLTPLVELPHNGSLIHDDIEDNSDERRGKPAVHLLYGTDTAINSGCFLYFLPLLCLKSWKADAERINEVYQCWGEHLRRIHLGQAMDIAWHRTHHFIPSVQEYELMCRLKTGVLARLSAELGVYAAGNRVHIKSEKTLARQLGIASENLGVGFQILDDVKNLRTGNPGKKRGDDFVEGKKSLPIILYLHKNKEAVDFVSSCFKAARTKGTEASEVEELISELEKAGSIEEAYQTGLRLIKEAKDTFNNTAFQEYACNREALKDLLELISLFN